MAVHSNGNGQKKVRSKKGESFRFDLDLEISPWGDITNEFHYTRLVADKERKDASVGDDPIPEESDAKLAAIARHFEEKYAPKSKSKGGNLDSDLIDRGYGYDVEDSFVDDTEAYEDYVPPTVDTEHGGFYINTGQLEFKKTGGFEGLELGTRMKQKVPKVKKQSSHQTPQAILANQLKKKAKQHLKSPKQALFGKVGGGITKEKMAAKKKDKPLAPGLTQSTLSQSSSLSCVIEPSVPISIGSRSVSLSVPIFQQSSTSPTASDVAARGSVIASTQPTVLAAIAAAATEGKAPEGSEEAPVKQPPVLPLNLPPDLIAKVKHLEEVIVRDQGPEGKLSAKTRMSYDEQLVEIEAACKIVYLKTRNAVFEYLAFKMGVVKGTLSKRVKMFLRRKADEDLEMPLQRLKEAVERSMPELVAAYEEEVRERAVSASSAFGKLMEADEESRMEEGTEEPVFSASSSSSSSTTQLKELISKPKSRPRKKYKWTKETKQLLCEVVRIKAEGEETTNRIGRCNGEEIIMQFLEEKVRPLWPKGWMQKQVLFRLTEHVHKQTVVKKVTVKKEKAAVVKTEPTSATSNAPKQSSLISPQAPKQVKTSPSITLSKASAFSPVCSSNAIMGAPVLSIGKSKSAFPKTLASTMPSVSPRIIPAPSAKVNVVQAANSSAATSVSNYVNFVPSVGRSQVVFLPQQVLSSASGLLPITLSKSDTSLKYTNTIAESCKGIPMPVPVTSTTIVSAKTYGASATVPLSNVRPVQIPKPVLVPSLSGITSSGHVSSQQLSSQLSSLQSYTATDVVKLLLSSAQDLKPTLLPKKSVVNFSPVLYSPSRSSPSLSTGSDSLSIQRSAIAGSETVSKPNIASFQQGKLNNVTAASTTTPPSSSAPSLSLPKSAHAAMGGLTPQSVGSSGVFDDSGGNGGMSLTLQRRVSAASVPATSPLKSPVEQIFSEHSYGTLLAAQQQQPLSGGPLEHDQETGMECASEGDSETVLSQTV